MIRFKFDVDPSSDLTYVRFDLGDDTLLYVNGARVASLPTWLREELANSLCRATVAPPRRNCVIDLTAAREARTARLERKQKSASMVGVGALSMLYLPEIAKVFAVI